MKKQNFIVLSFILCLMTSCIPGLNLHQVEEGKVWRSKQLNQKQLKKVIEKTGIKAILNLRGHNPGSDWFDEQLEVVEQHGLQMVSIGMSANRLPHKEDLVKLMDALKDLPRPFLIHCKAGADRTGEAAAIYQMEYMGMSKEDALKSLSPKYFHLTSFTPAKRYFIDEIYIDEQWARTEYDPCGKGYEHYDESAFCNDAGARQVVETDDLSDT